MIVVYQTTKIKTGFSIYANSAFAAFVNGIIAALTGNVSYPLTQPMLEGLVTALATFNSAMANAENRDKAMIGLRNTARTELSLQLTSVAASVIFEAEGDRDKLLTSGFQLYKNRDVPPSPLGPVLNFRIKDAEIPVGLTVECDGVKGIKTYTHQITPDPLTAESAWTGFASTSKEYTFADLPSGKKFWCRTIATGTKGQTAYSNTLSRITQ